MSRQHFSFSVEDIQKVQVMNGHFLVDFPGDDGSPVTAVFIAKEVPPDIAEILYKIYRESLH